jgi:hypothetical protein
MTASLETAGKVELRLLCKSNGVKGYGNMTTEQMRAALRGHAPERLTDAVPVTKVDALLPVTDDGHTPIRAARKAKRKAPKKATGKLSDKPSVKEWLQAQLDKHGEVKVDASKKWVTDSGRSLVTLYRQAQECGARLDRKAGVWRRAKS